MSSRARAMQAAGAAAVASVKQRACPTNVNTITISTDQLFVIFDMILSYCFEYGSSNPQRDRPLQKAAFLVRSLCKYSRDAFDAHVSGLTDPSSTLQMQGHACSACFEDRTQRLSWAFSACVFCGSAALSKRVVGRPFKDRDSLVLTCDSKDCRPSFILRMCYSSAFVDPSLGVCTTDTHQNRHLLHLALTKSKTLVVPISRQVWKCISSREGKPIHNSEVAIVVHCVDAGQISFHLNLPTDAVASIFGPVAGNVPSAAILWSKLFKVMPNRHGERSMLVSDLLKLGIKIHERTDSESRKRKRKVSMALRHPPKMCRHDLQNIRSLMRCSACDTNTLKQLKCASNLIRY